MSEIPAALESLLLDLENLLRPELNQFTRWIRVRPGQMRTSTSRKYEISLELARRHRQIASLPSYKALEQSVQAHPVLRDATRRAGYWGQTDTLIARIVSISGAAKHRRVKFDRLKATTCLDEFIALLGCRSLDVIGSARILGLSLLPRSVALAPKTVLQRLTVALTGHVPERGSRHKYPRTKLAEEELEREG